MPFPLRRLLPLTLVLASAAQASDEGQLIDAINALRAEPRLCDGVMAESSAPLQSDLRLTAPTSTDINQLQQALGESGYPAARLRLIRLSGPATPEAALSALSEKFCKPLLAAQFTDIGVSRSASEWRIVLARPLLSAGLGDWQAEGRALLQQVNQARATPRACGDQTMPAAPPLQWNDSLAQAARVHSQDMANSNVFAHQGSDGSQVDERVLREGYGWSALAENLAAAVDTPQRVVEAWLASPGHCRNLMSAQLRETGAAYAVDPRSDAGIYWTQVYAAP